MQFSRYGDVMPHVQNRGAHSVGVSGTSKRAER